MAIKTIKYRGLANRWAVNVMGITFLAMCIIGLVTSLVIKTYYTESIKEYMANEIINISDTFSTYSAKDTDTFFQGAEEYLESFTERDKMELQFLNKNGDMVVGSSGFPMSKEQLRVTQPVENQTTEKQQVFEGRLDGEEEVFVTSSDVYRKDNSNVKLGTIRMIVSRRETNNTISYLIIITIVVLLILFLIILFSGIFFLKSITEPIKELGSITGQIGDGDFDVRIESKGHDEISYLCDSINNLAEELGSTEKMKNEFISSVSHELRTPLTAIKGWAETVKTAADDPVMVQKGLSVVISETERLSQLVEDLLDFSRLQNGQMTYNFAPCDIVAELSEAVLTYTAQASKQDVSLTYIEPTGVPVIEGDAARLQQVFINIIDNALKYTPAGGAINIGTKLIDGYLEIMISDNGAGIDEDDLKNIKNKFYKGAHSVHGCGIGLAVADEIIQKHTGTLVINSMLNVGTTVTIKLPVSGRKEETTNEQ